MGIYILSNVPDIKKGVRKKSGVLMCPRHQSATADAPRLRPLQARRRQCRPPALGRGVPPEGRQLNERTPEDVIFPSSGKLLCNEN